MSGTLPLELSRDADSEGLHTETLKIRQRVLGKGHPDTIESINNLAGVFNSGDVEMVRALLDAGAIVDEKMLVLGEFLMTPLVAVTRRGDTAMVEFLIEREANPNEETKDKMTPLFRATINNHLEAVKLLIAKSARVNHQHDLGFTPLVWAAYIDSGDTEIVEILLAAGADRDAKDDQGWTALEVARELGHTSIATVLARRATPP